MRLSRRCNDDHHRYRIIMTQRTVRGESVSHTEILEFKTNERYCIIPITSEVERIVSESGVIDGLVLVNPMHITASIYVNDQESGLHQDIMQWLEKVAPYHGPEGRTGPEYHHHMTGEDNGDAHLKRQLLGQQVVMPITDGQLHLGTWERIHYAEFDGRRRKRVLVKVTGIAV